MGSVTRAVVVTMAGAALMTFALYRVAKFVDSWEALHPAWAWVIILGTIAAVTVPMFFVVSWALDHVWNSSD